MSRLGTGHIAHNLTAEVDREGVQGGRTCSLQHRSESKKTDTVRSKRVDTLSGSSRQTY